VKSSSRWLLAFGVTIGVLVIAAVVLVLTMPTPETRLLPEDTPGGTVQRYFLALQAEDYVTAYSYLSPPSPPLTEIYSYEQWRSPSISSEEKPEWKVTLGKSAVKDSEATVDVTVDTFRPGGPFQNPVRTQHVTFFLEKEGTSWKITSPWYVWWLFY
jgi:hypothetical protein